MNYCNNLSLKAKLILLAVSSATIAVAITGLWMAKKEMLDLKETKVERLSSQARMIAFNSTGVLSFLDQEAAQQLLQSLESEPTVDLACLYDAEGNLFASYSAKGGEDAFPTDPTFANCYKYDSKGNLEVYEDVVDQGVFLGNVMLRANSSDILAKQKAGLLTILEVAFLSLSLAAVLSIYLQKGISDPIYQLSETANEITQSGDYSLRVKKASNDELGQLCDAFNLMLIQVEKSKGALIQAHNELEERVSQRTEQLSDEIVQRERIQKDLEVSVIAAESANRAKSEFLANMSHEIRTPLNGILGFTDLVAQQGEALSPAERAEYLSHIQVSGKHLLSLINDILDLSKIESDRIKLELLDYSPHALLAEVVSLMRVRAKEKGLTLDSQWKGPLPKTISTDPTRLRQVLVNLVGNAIKFTSEGSVRLVAQVEESKAGNNRLRIDVIDSGIGIPEDKLETIFAPFSQADNSVTRKFGGTGLGLTISRKLTSALGGDLWVESCVDYGSTFTVAIDVGSLANTEMLSSPPGDGIASPQQIKKTASAGSELTGARILLVEDGEINRKLIIALLTQAGVTEIDTAENGEIGVRKATSRDYDLILLDMQMPVMDGYTAATTLREKRNLTPIIALTAHAMKGDKEKCMDAGCNDYLTKPVVAGDLIAKIREWFPEEEGSAPFGIDSNEVDTTDENSRLYSTLPTDNPVFLEIVQDFGDLLEDCLPKLRAAAENQEGEPLERLAHSLLGTAGGAGFDEFTEPARQLEKLAIENRFPEAIETLQTIEKISLRVDIPVRTLISSV